MSSAIDIDHLAEVLRDAAEKKIMPHFRALNAENVREKASANDLVTIADEEAERFIKAQCAELFPRASFIGEESAAADPMLLDSLGKAELAIVVDPLDGTANFAAGTPLFAVTAAVVVRAETVAGIIYDPIGRDFLLASKGGGAFLERGGRRVSARVAEPVAVDQMVGTGSINMFSLAERRQLFPRLAEVGGLTNFRNAGHEYWAVATGHLHFCFYKRLMPWDHLAGSLIVQEAGGYVRRFNGSLYRVTDREGGLLVASDKKSWRALQSTLFRCDRKNVVG